MRYCQALGAIFQYGGAIDGDNEMRTMQSINSPMFKTFQVLPKLTTKLMYPVSCLVLSERESRQT